MPFSPSSLFAAGEDGIWIDPSDLSTLFQDSAGTIPVTAAGQSVARARDKSGKGYDLTQTFSARCPTYQVDGNGKPYLSFSGGQVLWTSTAPTGNNHTAGFADSSNVAGATSAPYQVEVSSTDRIAIRDDGSVLSFGFYNGSFHSKSGTPTTATKTLLGTIDKTTLATTLRINGADQNGVSNPSTSGSVGIYLGANAATGAAGLIGAVYGLVHVSRTLTTTERTNLEAYLTALYTQAASAGSSSGSAAVAGQGASGSTGVGSSAAAATASGSGAAQAIAAGSATGAASALGAAQALVVASGVSAGAAAVSGAGAALAVATGVSDGTSTVSGASGSNDNEVGDGTAQGAARASGQGAALQTGAGLAEGFGVAVGAGQSVALAAGTSSGAATAAGVGAQVAASVTPLSRRGEVSRASRAAGVGRSARVAAVGGLSRVASVRR